MENSDDKIELSAQFHEDDFYFYRGQYEDGVNFFGDRKSIPSLGPYHNYGTPSESPIPAMSQLLQSLPEVINGDICETCEKDDGKMLRQLIKEKFEEFFEKNKTEQFSSENNMFDFTNGEIVITDKKNREYTYVKSTDPPKMKYSVVRNELKGSSTISTDVSENIYRKITDNDKIKYVDIHNNKICDDFNDCSDYVEGIQDIRLIDNLVKYMSSIEMNLYPDYAGNIEYSNQIKERNNIQYDAHTDELVNVITNYYKQLCINRMKSKNFIELVGDGDDLTEQLYQTSIEKTRRQYINIFNITLGTCCAMAIFYEFFTKNV